MNLRYGIMLLLAIAFALISNIAVENWRRDRGAADAAMDRWMKKLGEGVHTFPRCDGVFVWDTKAEDFVCMKESK